MNHVGTHPEITNIENNGLSEDEPEVQACPCCEKSTYTKNLCKCEKCKDEICPMCPDSVFVAVYGWRFCCKECAVEHMTEQLQEVDDRIFRIRQTVKIALQELEWGNETPATARLRTVLEQTKG